MARKSQRARAKAQAKANASPPKPVNPPRSRKKRSRRNTNIHHFSPHVPGLIPSINPQGEAFPIGGVVEYDLTTSSTNRYALFATNVGTSGTVGVIMTWGKGGGAAAAATTKIFTIPTLALADDAGGPTSMRAMKCGVDIVAHTQLLSRGGTVVYFNSQQRLRLGAAPTALTSANLDALWDTVVNHQDKHTMDVVDFNQPKHTYSNVVDAPTYDNFDVNNGTLNITDFFGHISVWPGSAPAQRPMSSMIYLFDTTSVPQIMTISVRASFYSRWPLDTVPGQNTTDVPTASPTTVQQASLLAHADARRPPALSSALLGYAGNALRAVAGNPSHAINAARGVARLVNAYGGMRGGRMGPRAFG